MVQDKLARTVVLTWLWQCINSYLVRFAASAPRDRMDKFLEKCTKPVLAALRKGSFAFSNQLVRFISLLVLLAGKHLVHELLQAEVMSVLPIQLLQCRLNLSTDPTIRSRAAPKDKPTHAWQYPR